MPIKIIIADDHPLILDGIRQILKNTVEFQVIGTALTFDTLITLLSRPCDILILDLNMQEESSLDRIESIRAIQSNIKILIFTSYNTPSLVRKAFKKQVNGYLLKDTTEKNLIQALNDITNGQKHIGQKVKIPKRNFAYSNKMPTDFQDNFVKVSSLTKREQEIAQLIVEGLENQTIGEQLFISPNTVHSHRKKIFKKLNVHSATELVKLFINRK